MSSSDDEIDDAESKYESDYELGSIGGSKIYTLGHAPEYCDSWFTRDAFREFYQNWYVLRITRLETFNGPCRYAHECRRDALINTFSLDPADFSPHYEEDLTNNEILITVRHPLKPPHENLLGYIKFRWGSNNRGHVEIVNFQASLDPSCLRFGCTTKRGDPTQAGQHGEGSKSPPSSSSRGRSRCFLRAPVSLGIGVSDTEESGCSAGCAALGIHSRSRSSKKKHHKALRGLPKADTGKTCVFTWARRCRRDSPATDRARSWTRPILQAYILTLSGIG